MRVFKDIRTLTGILTRPQRRQAYFLVILIFLAAIAETLGIGAILPFVSMMTNPEIIHENRWLAQFFAFSGATTSTEFMVICGVVLMLLFVGKNSFLAFLLYLQSSFSRAVSVSLANRLLENYLRSPYLLHLERNSADMIRVITGDAHAISNTLLRPLIIIATESVLVVSIILLLAIVNPLMTAATIALFGLTAAIIFYGFRRRVVQIGTEVQRNSSGMIKWISQSLGGIKETKASGSEQYFLDAFRQFSHAHGDNNLKLQIIQQMPRLLLESVAIVSVLIAILVTLTSGTRNDAILPLVAVFVAAATRLMPSVNRILVAVGQFKFGGAFLETVARDIALSVDIPRPGTAGATLPFQFNRAVELRNVTFRYDNAAKASLDCISLEVRKGESIGIVGASGAGKTTLINLILGLIPPTGGDLLVDGRNAFEDVRAWQRLIGYVSQDAFLLDDTIRANVAFGVPSNQISEERLSRAIGAAHLEDFIAGLPDGLDTLIGERGTRISGGQRQRIAIARALYREPSVLLLDEATASLDNDTEHQVTEGIEQLGSALTLIVVAHRLNTVRNCDRLYLMEGGRIAACGSYEEVIGNADGRSNAAGSARS